MVKLNSVKIQLIIFLSCFAAYLSIQNRDLLFLLAISIAIILAMGTDSIILYFKNKKFILTESSIISGLIIGYVLSSDNPWWIFVLVPILAISSKHSIRIQGRHLFNPAAFGILLANVLFEAQTQWKGTYLWYVLVPFGLYFIFRIKKLEIIIGYSLASLGLFGIQAIIQKIPLGNIFGYLSYFYIFIILIEPKTTPINLLGKFLFGVSVAVLIFVLTEAGLRFDTELCALLILNLFTPLLNKISERRS